MKYLENGIHFEDNSVEEDNDENMRSDVPASSPEVRIISEYLELYFISFVNCISHRN